MKVLLLHPEDSISQSERRSWDLVVDLARAPEATYAEWRNQLGCEVISVYEFAEERADLDRLRELLQLGTAALLDASGIDWWEVLSLELIGDLSAVLLARRLANYLSQNFCLHTSRPHVLASSLQNWLGSPLVNLQSRTSLSIRRVQHYYHQCSTLNSQQLLQIIEDKLAPLRTIALGRTSRSRSGNLTILCPTAYSNASRTVLSYAAHMPDQQFSLVYTRRSGKLGNLPSNVRQFSLAPCINSFESKENADLLAGWHGLRRKLVAMSDLFQNADASGVLDGFPALLRWGLVLRDAWNRVFQREEFEGCLCTDDSNPPTRIPLILAKQKGLPCAVTHHGALDYAMAIKQHCADFYIAKTEMERDYLIRTCHVQSKKVVVASIRSDHSDQHQRTPPCRLVFFTEPYQNFGWRVAEVYRALLLRLHRLASCLNLNLVFKLHPFESERGFCKMLMRHDRGLYRNTRIVSGPITDEFWQSVRLALTVQSSVALECRDRNIPTFLCTWLRDSWSGYTQQFVKFGFAHPLKWPEEIDDIPYLLENSNRTRIGQNCAIGMKPMGQLFAAHRFPEYARS